MSDGYTVAPLDELVAYELPGQARWHTIRSALDIQAFGINAWTAIEDGQQLIGEHDEADGGEGHEELYVVLTGQATFTLNGKTVEAPGGTLVHVRDPKLKRGAVGARGTTVLAIGAKPGEAFTPSSWERSAEALRFWPSEDWNNAIEVLERHLAETPEHAGSLYNLACAHARAGRPVDALDRLREAITLEERFSELAQTDEDLASVREDPGFPRA